MRKGTTPTHTFGVSIDPILIKEIKITYAQDDVVLFYKKKNDCSFENGAVITKLTQEDTFLFDHTKFVSIQLRILTTGNDVIESDIIIKSVGKCLDDEVLV
jgi:hypothetical protein